jgi:putative ABC transport system permease protein
MTLWFTFALRNLRSGLKGFWILLSCLTLGVAALAIIGSLSSGLKRGLDEQGQQLLGGDIEFALVQREASPAEKQWLAAQGAVSQTTTLRAMAQSPSETALVEIKAIDGAYPLYGTLQINPQTPDTFKNMDGIFGAAVDETLLSRLGVKLGDTIKIGSATIQIRATITTEPDKIAGGISFGPRLMLSPEALTTTGLVQPGSLITNAYRIKLAQPASLADGQKLEKLSTEKFPDAGWRVRTTDKAAQGADEFISRLGYFMTLVSVAALVVAGAGIANATRAFVERRREQIAVLNCLGIQSRDVIAISLIEIMLVSLLGIAIALVLGALSPFAVKLLFGSILPLPLVTSLDVRPLGLAAILGLLITAAFALWPLGRISKIKGASLFRSQGLDEQGLPKHGIMAASLGLLALAGLIVLFAFDDKRVTASYLAGLVVSFGLLTALARGVIALVRHLPRPQNMTLRHALSNLARPGSTAISVIMALGLGLALFVTLALTDRIISTELRAGLPEKAPAFFFLDVQNPDLQNFETALKAQTGIIDLTNSPMLRGRITKVKGTPSETYKASADSSWALKGDRGLTYSEELPKGSTLVEGKWWAKDYSGPPLVSMTDDIAKGLDLKIGDHITVNVLGREVEAELASTRKVNWKGLGINFVLVFTPNTLVNAPHAHIVTAGMNGGDEGAVLKSIAKDFPSVTGIRVKDALDTVSALLSKMLVAVRGANVVSLLTGVLVLAGALAAGLSTRSYDVVVLKTYGASRAQLLWGFVVEYGLLGLLAAGFGIVTGTLAAWGLARFVLDMPFQFSFVLALSTAAIAMALTILAGLTVTWAALSAKPSFYLRNG